MSTNRDEVLRQFCDVTGVDESRSRFFLESSNWQLEIALSSFYEHGGNVDEAPVNPPAAAPALPYLSGSSDMDSPPGSPVQPQKKEKKKTTRSTNNKFATLDTLQQDSSSEEEEESIFGWVKTKVTSIYQEKFCSDGACPKKVDQTTSKANSLIEHTERLEQEVESLKIENAKLRSEIARLLEDRDNDEGQAFYAGGSERSGQQILGPGKGRKDIVSEMFKSVRERGAVVFEDEPSTASQPRGAFGGTGYRLGQTADDHEPVTSEPAPQSAREEAGRLVRLQLYREGFTVDGGRVRPYADQENADFLNCIRRGKIPLELAAGGGEVRVSMEDRRHRAPAAPAAAPAFAGAGHLLGSPTPATVGAASTDEADRAANHRHAQEAVQLDEASPVTTVQFRLSDGRRLTGRFNHSHRVSALTAYLRAAEPQYCAADLALATAFPTTELTDPDATLAQANVLNSTVMIRIK